MNVECSTCGYHFGEVDLDLYDEMKQHYEESYDIHGKSGYIVTVTHSQTNVEQYP